MFLLEDLLDILELEVITLMLETKLVSSEQPLHKTLLLVRPLDMQLQLAITILP